MPDLLIRRGTAEDLPEVVKLWQEFMDHHAACDASFARSEQAPDAFAAYVAKGVTEGRAALFVAQCDGSLGGYCLASVAQRPTLFASSNYGLISDLAVTANRRRNGIGRRLLAEALAWLKAQKMSRIEVRVLGANGVAMSFWRRAGFRTYMDVMFLEVVTQAPLAPQTVQAPPVNADFRLPAGLDVRLWVERWDRMQERYLVRREERFDTLVRLVGAARPQPAAIVDLGCGTGSVMCDLLRAFPAAEVYGVDFDPTLLPLARERLREFGSRAHLVLTDLRRESWTGEVPGGVDAVVSATAVHWLNPDDLATLYAQVAKTLRPGGVFLNADHVASDCLAIQRAWEEHRARMRIEEGHQGNEDWTSFWKAYMQALGLEARQIHERVLNGWRGGVEAGLPLAWHLEQLRAAGFASVDCFWRCDCDAIYGGVRA